MDKRQGYLLGKYKFYWSKVWDSLQSDKETAFTWSIWHKVVEVNEWKVCITPTSICKQYNVFFGCLPNTNE